MNLVSHEIAAFSQHLFVEIVLAIFILIGYLIGIRAKNNIRRSLLTTIPLIAFILLFCGDLIEVSLFISIIGELFIQIFLLLFYLGKNQEGKI